MYNLDIRVCTKKQAEIKSWRLKENAEKNGYAHSVKGHLRLNLRTLDAT